MSVKDYNSRLGRGLASLMGDVPRSDYSNTDITIRLLPASSLRPGPFQARRSVAPESLRSLAESIRATGILQPIVVRPAPDEPDAYQIVAGERRWQAAQIASLHELPCLVRRLTDTEAMTAGLVENLQRQDLNAIEEAEGYRRLATEFRLSADEIARLIGRSRSHVANTMRLLALPEPVQGEVRNGALSAGHARALLSHSDPQRGALQVIAGGLNVRQTEALSQPQQRRQSLPTDTTTASLERELADHLGLRVSIRHGQQGGSLRIDYADLDQLDGLIAFLMQRSSPLATRPSP